MTSPAYGTRAGLYAHGLRADALVSIPRAVTAVDIPTSTFTLRGHGLIAGAVLTVETRGGTLPSPLSSALPYQAAPVSGDLFKLAGITLVDAGRLPFSIILDLDSIIDDSLRAWSRHIDQHLPAHSTPLVLVPEHIELWLYWLASFDLVVTRGLGNPSYKDSTQALADRAKLAQAKLDAMEAKTKSVVGAVDQTPSVAERAPRAVSAGDRGWDNGGLGL